MTVMSDTPETIARSPHIIGPAAILCAIAAVVFANQPNELATIGRTFHLASIALLAALLFLYRRNAVAYIGLCAMLFAIGVAGYRLPYEVALCVLFMGAGIVIGSLHRKAATIAVLAATIASGLLMFLQVAGVSEWTQILTTHGTVAGAPDVPKIPMPTIFLGYREVEANFLQGRPAGLFHSNQFASLIILFALALSISRKGERSLVVDTALCATAVLSLAKVVFLGLALMLIYRFVSGGREGKAAAMRFAALTAVALVAYAVLFPGMFQLYFFNAHNVWQSVASRVADMLAVLGFSPDQIRTILMSDWFTFGMRRDGQIKDALVDHLASVDKQGRTTAFSTLAHHAAILYGGGAAAILLFSLNTPVRRNTAAWCREHFSHEHVTLLIAIGSFCLAANFLGAPIFWLIAGFAVPLAVLAIDKS